MLVGYEMIMVSSAIRISLAIHHLVGDPDLELGRGGGGGGYFACSTGFSSSCDSSFLPKVREPVSPGLLS